MSSGNGKGKGRATGEGDFDGDSAQSDSLIGRVLHSASSLANSAFAAPTHNELSNHTSSALASAGKAHQLNNASSSAWSESSKAVPPVTAQSFPKQSDLGNRGHQQEHADNAEAEFSSFLDGIGTFAPSDIAEPVPVAAGQFELNQPSSLASQAGQNNWAQQYGTIEEQMSRDGAEVINLLSDPSSSLPEKWEIYNGRAEDEPVVWKMTELQRTEWNQRLRYDFPETTVSEDLSKIESTLDLIPHVGFATVEDKQQWLEQWDGVLNRYTDEVWGDLLPLVQKAREEISTLEKSNGESHQEQSKALRRLGLVLGHLMQ